MDASGRHAGGTITATGYGGFGQVLGTLPAGFSYEGSDLSEVAVAVEGQTVAFTLLGDERLTYTVAAPSAEGSYSFSRVLLDANKAASDWRRFHHQGRPPSYPHAGADGHADARAYAHAHAGAHAHGHADAGASDRVRPGT